MGRATCPAGSGSATPWELRRGSWPPLTAALRRSSAVPTLPCAHTIAVLRPCQGHACPRPHSAHARVMLPLQGCRLP